MTAVPLARPSRAAWLFSPGLDLLVFGGSALVALLAMALGTRAGLSETPDWAWVPAVLMVDVAHVWCTGFRVYLDVEAFRRRPFLYGAIPAACLVGGVVLYAYGSDVFWRALAYLAVFHFVRQQYGWVVLYRGKAGERDRLGHWIDGAAIYASTLYPLVWWHAHMPRHFWWFMAGDFTTLPGWLSTLAWPLYVAALAAYAARAAVDAARGQVNLGKHVVVATTALLWYVGIVSFNSDWAFTITNVLPHGIPYIVLIFWYGRRRLPRLKRPGAMRLFDHPWVFYLSILWLVAYLEEMLWDKSIWQERGWLFGAPWDVHGWQGLMVPLLALPQLVHYVLDGFIWRRRDNPELADL